MIRSSCGSTGVASPCCSPGTSGGGARRACWSGESPCASSRSGSATTGAASRRPPASSKRRGPRSRSSPSARAIRSAIRPPRRSPGSRQPTPASIGPTVTAPSSSRPMACGCGSRGGLEAPRRSSTSTRSVARRLVTPPSPGTCAGLTSVKHRRPPVSPEAVGGTRGEREGGSGPERALVVSFQPLQLLRIKAHAEGEPHLSQDGLDLVQRFLPEILRLEQLRLGSLDQVGDGADIGGLVGVGGANRQLQLVHAPKERLVEAPAQHPLGPRLPPLHGRRRRAPEIG